MAVASIYRVFEESTPVESDFISQSNSWDFAHADHSGSGVPLAFRPIPSLSSSQKTTMFSRLSASKATLKSLGTAARTPSSSSSAVRFQAKLRSFSNPHFHISVGPVSLLQCWSSSCSGRYFILLLLPFVSDSLNQQSLASRTALASASILTLGSIAWYTHLYGTLPFLGEVHANSPAEDGLHPTAYPWPHNGLLDTFDHARYSPRPVPPIRFF